jgi:hypothetical protein
MSNVTPENYIYIYYLQHLYVCMHPLTAYNYRIPEQILMRSSLKIEAFL